MLNIARRFRLVLWLYGFYLILGGILRSVLWWAFGTKAGIPATHLAAILPAGAINDLIEATYLLAPLSLYIAALPDHFYQSTWNRRVLWVGFGITVVSLLYLCPVEYYFFEEFDSRFNIVATDYLIFPHEVFNDIWTAYPVGRTFTVVIILTASILWLVRRLITDSQAAQTNAKSRWIVGAAHAGALSLLIASINTGTLVPNGDRVATQLAINGHAQFFEALRTSEIDYHAYYRSLNPEESYRILRNQLAASGGVPTTAQLERLDRRFPENPSGLGKLNVVVVMEESLGAEFSASLGGKKDLTPNLDAYGREGLWVTHMYAQGTRTVRGLEAISSSFPPIPTVSIVRRPNNSNIATWGKVMKAAGYSTSFLYGGYGYFDNMNTFFEGNGYEVVDRTAMPKARFENIWGVSDEDLFDAALNHFDEKAKSGRPFFAQIMTTSNHKPFTFRPGIPGIPERGGGREAGVRYADFALDYFLKEARRHSWFDNTLFVIVADHGARVYGKSQIPIRSYEIPCLIWAPKHVKPAAIDELASQIDLAPTVLGLLGLPYQAPFFGRDILADTPNPPIMLFSHNHDVGLYDGEHLIVLGMQRQVWNYRYDRTADHLIESPHDPNLEKLAVSYYQTASELFRDHRYE